MLNVRMYTNVVYKNHKSKWISLPDIAGFRGMAYDFGVIPVYLVTRPQFIKHLQRRING